MPEQQQAQASPAPLATPSGIDTLAVFVDSTGIGKPGRNKVSLISIRTGDSINTVVRFYEKKESGWILRSSFAHENWSWGRPEPEMSDFNNDGYKDLAYITGTGGRGGNVEYALYIYDKKGDSLLYVRNAGDYPNLHYNKETASINSMILTGGNETVFLRLRGDSLVPFASIFQFGRLVTVTEYKTDGTSKVIKEDSTGFEEFAQFTNYKPLRAKK